MCEEKTEPEIADLTVLFTQKPDTCDGESIACQDLEIQVVSVGDGHFFRLKTERWAFDDPKELTALVRRVKAMLKR